MRFSSMTVLAALLAQMMLGPLAASAQNSSVAAVESVMAFPSNQFGSNMIITGDGTIYSLVDNAVVADAGIATGIVQGMNFLGLGTLSSFDGRLEAVAGSDSAFAIPAQVTVSGGASPEHVLALVEANIQAESRLPVTLALLEFFRATDTGQGSINNPRFGPAIVLLLTLLAATEINLILGLTGWGNFEGAATLGLVGGHRLGFPLGSVPLQLLPLAGLVLALSVLSNPFHMTFFPYGAALVLMLIAPQGLLNPDAVPFGILSPGVLFSLTFDAVLGLALLSTLLPVILITYLFGRPGVLGLGAASWSFPFEQWRFFGPLLLVVGLLALPALSQEGVARGPTQVPAVMLATGPTRTDAIPAANNPADFDASGLADQGDFQQLLDCFTGPGAGDPLSATCQLADFDDDGDVDYRDFARFAELYEDPGFPAPAPQGAANGPGATLELDPDYQNSGLMVPLLVAGEPVPGCPELTIENFFATRTNNDGTAVVLLSAVDGSQNPHQAIILINDSGINCVLRSGQNLGDGPIAQFGTITKPNAEGQFAVFANLDLAQMARGEEATSGEAAARGGLNDGAIYRVTPAAGSGPGGGSRARKGWIDY